ncbi:MAG: DEAD/DEAH box helicase [Aliidongia sp.]
MPQLDAHADLARDGRVFITPGPYGRLRGLERALRAAGVSLQIDPAAGGAFVDMSQFAACRTALDGWSFAATSGLVAAAEAFEARRAWHAAALEACRIADADPSAARGWLEGYDRIKELDAHQITAVALAAHPDVRGLCIFDEQGLGKTVEALFAFDRLYEQDLVGRAVVFAPKNMVLEWVHDLQRFFGTKYRAAAVVGDEVEKRAILDSGADLFVTNFETAIQLEIRLRHLLQGEKGRGLLIVDESFFVKNAEAQRAQALRSLRRHSGRCLVLCGTPAPNSALDLVEQFNIADDGEAFRGIKIPTDPGEARDVIAATIEARGVYIRRLKGAVLPNLPERTFSQVLLPLPPAQRRLYDSVMAGLLDDIEAVDEMEFKRNLASFMARRAALLQICSNPSAVEPTFAEVPAKFVALDGILEDLIDQKGEKVVLWSFFTASINAICTRYARYHPVRIDGSVSAVADRREAVRRFQDDDRTMLFVGNPAAAGAGLTLHRARFAVYESMSNQAAHYLQSLDRIHRRGQLRPVEYIILLCDETLETAEYGRLLRKESEAQHLLGDEVRPPVTRQAFLEEILGHPPLN